MDEAKIADKAARKLLYGPDEELFIYQEIESYNVTRFYRLIGLNGEGILINYDSSVTLEAALLDGLEVPMFYGPTLSPEFRKFNDINNEYRRL